MRSIALLTLLVLACLSQSMEGLYRIISDREIGDAKIIQEIRTDGTVRTCLEINLTNVGFFSKVDQITGKDGTPIRLVSINNIAGESRATVLSYTKTEVKLVQSVGDKSSTKTFPIPQDKACLDPSVIWFIVLRPKVGEVTAGYNFSAESKTWIKNWTRYIGPDKIQLNGEPVEAHKCESKLQTYWLDDSGRILRLVSRHEGQTVTIELKKILK